MKRFELIGGAMLVTLTLAACGGGDAASEAPAESAPAAAPAAEPAAAAPAEMTMPEWYRLDEASMTVELDIAGQQDGGWKFNGFINGEATVVVPEGYTVVLNFTNDDPGMVHSVGVAAMTSGFPPVFDAVQPVFEGAVTSNATSMTEGTAPGESETITFVADAAGEYSLVCFIPSHALAGMWIGFTVSADGEAGVMQ